MTTSIEPRVGDYWQLRAEFRGPWSINASDGGALKDEVLAVKDGWVLYRAGGGCTRQQLSIDFARIRELHHNDDQLKTGSGVIDWLRAFLKESA